MKKKYFYFGLILCFLSVFYFFIPKPKISVVLPTYNRAEFLPRAIQSILNQTYKDFELIIVDDASTDESVQIIEEFMEKDSRIKLIKNTKNLGVAESRNIGNNAAQGEYIAVMDSDDQALPWRLEVSLDYMKKNPDIDVFSAGQFNLEKNFPSFEILNHKNLRIDKTFSPLIMVFYNPIINVSVLMKSSFIRKHNIKYNSDYQAAEDYDFWKQVYLKGGKIARVENPLTLVRMHTTNDKAYYKQMEDNSIQIHKELISLFFAPAENDVLYYYTIPQQCALMRKILNSSNLSKEKTYADFENYYNFRCPKNLSKSYFLSHPNWQSYVTLTEDNLYTRLFVNDKAHLVFWEDFLLAYWKEYPLEVFKKTTGKEFSFVQLDSYSVQHKNWSDEMVILSENRVCRAHYPDCATIVKKTPNSFSIIWDNKSYSRDTFLFDSKKNLYVLKTIFNH